MSAVCMLSTFSVIESVGVALAWLSQYIYKLPYQSGKKALLLPGLAWPRINIATYRGACLSLRKPQKRRSVSSTEPQPTALKTSAASNLSVRGGSFHSWIGLLYHMFPASAWQSIRINVESAFRCSCMKVVLRQCHRRLRYLGFCRLIDY